VGHMLWRNNHVARFYTARRWTEVVKAVLKRQASVAFAPKDLRSSFITFFAERRQLGRGPQEGRGAGHAPLDGDAGVGCVRQGARRAHVQVAGSGRVRRAL